MENGNILGLSSEPSCHVTGDKIIPEEITPLMVEMLHDMIKGINQSYVPFPRSRYSNIQAFETNISGKIYPSFGDL